MISRINSIKINKLFGDQGQVRRYAITYDTQSHSSNRSRIRTVQEFGTDNSTALPAYQLTWTETEDESWDLADQIGGYVGTEFQTGTNGLTAENAFTRFVPAAGSIPAYQYALGTVITDYNGDGYPDLLRRDSDLANKAWKNTGNKSWVEDPAFSSKLATLPLFSRRYAGTGGNSGQYYTVDQGVRFTDLNSDGYLDALWASSCDLQGNNCNLAAHVNAWLYDPAANGGSGAFVTQGAEGFSQALSQYGITFNLVYGTRQFGAGTYLTDVNADGFPDLIASQYGVGSTVHQVYLNTGTTFTTAPSGTFQLPTDQHGEPLYFARNATGGLVMPRDPGVRWADINGDGLIDIIQLLRICYQDYRGCSRDEGIWINNGRGWEFSTTRTSNLHNSLPSTIAFSQTNYTLDFIQHDCSSNPIDPTCVEFSQREDSNRNLGLEVLDVDGDGLDDLQSLAVTKDGPFQPDGVTPIQYNGINPISRSFTVAYRNTASGYFASVWQNRGYAMDQPLIYNVRSLVHIPYGGDTLVDLAVNNGVRFTDVDHDGHLDLLANHIYNGVQYGFVAGNHISFARDKLVGVLSPKGLSVSVSYMKTGFNDSSLNDRSYNPLLSLPKIVVKSILANSGDDGHDFLGINRKREFSYFGGRYDRVERQFAGFSAVVEAERVTAGRDQPENVLFTTTLFKNVGSERCHIGAESKVVTSGTDPSAGLQACYLNGTADDRCADWISGIYTRRDQSFAACAPGVTGPFFSPAIGETVWNYEGNSDFGGLPVSSKRFFTYDQFGNRTAEYRYKDAADQSPAFAAWGYYFQPTSSSPWLPRLACSSGTVSFESGGNVPLSGSYYYYDHSEQSSSSPKCAVAANGAGQLTQIKTTDWTPLQRKLGPIDAVTRFDYTPAGNIAVTTDPLGNQTVLDWQSSLPEIVPASSTKGVKAGISAGLRESYSYDDYGHLLSSVGPSNLRSETRYDALHRISSKWTESPTGQQIGLSSFIWADPFSSYVPYNQYVTETKTLDSGATIRQTTYFDGMGLVYLETTSDSSGNNAISRSMQHDGAGRVVVETLPYSGTEFSASAGAHPQTVTRYDPLGRVSSIQQPGGYTTQFTYDIYTRLVDDGSGTQIPLNYQHETQSFDNGDGSIRRKDKLSDSWGRVYQIAECNSASCGNPDPGIPGIQISTYSYDNAGNLVSVALPDGTAGSSSKTYNTFDAAGHTVLSKDPDRNNCYDASPQSYLTGCPIKQDYDAAGNLIRLSDAAYTAGDPLGVQTDFEYDTLNRLKRKIAHRGSSTSVSEFEYDTELCGRSNTAPAGQIVREHYVGFSPNEENSTTYCYDSFGRLSDKTVTTRIPETAAQVSHTLRYTYRQDGALKTITWPDGEVLTYTFDALGREDTLNTNFGGTVQPLVSHVNYEAFGPIESIQFANGLKTQFAYREDPAQQWGTPGGDYRLATISALSNTQNVLWSKQFEYDRLGNILDLIDSDGVSPDHEQFVYDYLNRLTDYSLEGNLVRSYSYDNLGNQRSRSSVGQSAVAAIAASLAQAYGAGQQLSSSVAPVDVAVGTSTGTKAKVAPKRRRGEVRSSVKTGQNGRASKRRTRTARKLRATRSGSPSAPETPGTTGRSSSPNAALGVSLTSSTSYMAYGQAYGGIAGPHAVRCVGASAGSTCSVPQQSWIYDRNGNPTSFSDLSTGISTTYSYDEGGRLRNTHTSAGLNITYYYDGNGRKRAGVDGAMTTIFADDSYTTNGSGVVRWKYYTIAGKRVAMRQGTGALQYLVTDHLGSLRATTIGPASLYGRRDYWPFGELLTSTNLTGIAPGFNGMQLDSAEQYDYHARKYIPALGRFLEADSVIPNEFSSASFNRYSYVRNNPVGYIDPSGHRESDAAYCAQSPRSCERDDSSLTEKQKQDELAMQQAQAGSRPSTSDAVQDDQGEIVQNPLNPLVKNLLTKLLDPGTYFYSWLGKRAVKGLIPELDAFEKQVEEGFKSTRGNIVKGLGDLTQSAGRTISTNAQNLRIGATMATSATSAWLAGGGTSTLIGAGTVAGGLGIAVGAHNYNMNHLPELAKASGMTEPEYLNHYFASINGPWVP